jgi:hypothetical protein
MKTLIPILALALLASPLRAAENNTLTPKEREAGWILLFDGRTLDGWRALKSETPGSGWKVINGEMVLVQKAGDILTVAEFGDFELSVEWKVEDATNSGIIYRVGLQESTTWRTGPEYQILDNHKATDIHDPKHLAGALYDLAAPPGDYTKPVGEWNLARIVVQGWHIQHWLNGVKIVDVDLSSPEGRSLVAHSKFRSMPLFATLSRGHIALQDEDQSVWYRNVKIRELK